MEEINKHITNKKFNIIVKANCPKTKIVKWDSEKSALRVEINAQAENNKANIELVKFFSKLLKKKVKIVKGLTNKNKVLLVQ